MSDVPVALLLSDGIGSNAMRAALAAQGHAPASYTFRLCNPIDRPLPAEHVRFILGGSLPPAEGYLDTVDRLYGACDRDAADLDRMQEIMLETFLSANILSFADSIAMDASAELRMPFLDRDLVEFALSLPPVERVSRWPGRANTKLILRRWAEERVPPTSCAGASGGSSPATSRSCCSTTAGPCTVASSMRPPGVGPCRARRRGWAAFPMPMAGPGVGPSGGCWPSASGAKRSERNEGRRSPPENATPIVRRSGTRGSTRVPGWRSTGVVRNVGRGTRKGARSRPCPTQSVG